jgi:hypothetical protein
MMMTFQKIGITEQKQCHTIQLFPEFNYIEKSWKKAKSIPLTKTIQDLSLSSLGIAKKVWRIKIVLCSQTSPLNDMIYFKAKTIDCGIEVQIPIV